MRTDLDLAFFRQRLLEREEALSRNRKVIEPVEVDQGAIGRVTRMDAIAQQAMAQAGAQLAEAELNRVRTALNRLETGEYGLCILCDEDIAEGRLRFDPSALTCIACARNIGKPSR